VRGRLGDKLSQQANAFVMALRHYRRNRDEQQQLHVSGHGDNCVLEDRGATGTARLSERAVSREINHWKGRDAAVALNHVGPNRPVAVIRD
jgi:hypothetical protein